MRCTSGGGRGVGFSGERCGMTGTLRGAGTGVEYASLSGGSGGGASIV